MKSQHLANKWREVGVSLPGTGVRVLVVYKKPGFGFSDPEVLAARYVPLSRPEAAYWATEHGITNPDSITHWMPMPALPNAA